MPEADGPMMPRLSPGTRLKLTPRTMLLLVPGAPAITFSTASMPIGRCSDMLGGRCG
ncbi:hypothetical protein D3C71_1942850 [compost metagenome]